MTDGRGGCNLACDGIGRIAQYAEARPLGHHPQVTDAEQLVVQWRHCRQAVIAAWALWCAPRQQCDALMATVASDYDIVVFGPVRGVLGILKKLGTSSTVYAPCGKQRQFFRLAGAGIAIPHLHASTHSASTKIYMTTS